MYEMVQALERCTTHEELHAKVAVITRGLGYGNLTIFAWPKVHSVTPKKPGVFRVHDLTPEWTDMCNDYASKKGVHPGLIDGITLTSLNNWSEERYGKHEIQLYKECADIGIRHGIAISTTRAAHAGLSAILVSRDSERVTRAELNDNEPLLLYLANKIDAVQMPLLRRILAQSAISPTSVNLTPKEREVLHWATECSKTASIAEKMGLSQWTVTGHKQSIQTKFGAVNFVDALRKAIEFRLL